MTTVLQHKNRRITDKQVTPMLTYLPMLSQQSRESLINQAITPFICTDDEIFTAGQLFYQRNNLNSESELQSWLKRCGMSREHLEEVITQCVRLEKFKQATWGHQVDYYFRRRKRELDRVVYSCLKTKKFNVALELYLNIKRGEQIFAEVARTFSEGSEAKSGGIIGPVELGTLSPNLAGLLRSSQSGQLWSPQPSAEGYVIVRLEKLIPARLDESMRQRLLNELFEAWLQEQMKGMGEIRKKLFYPNLHNCI
jgi:hypothetical protein